MLSSAVYRQFSCISISTKHQLASTSCKISHNALNSNKNIFHITKHQNMFRSYIAAWLYLPWMFHFMVTNLTTLNGTKSLWDPLLIAWMLMATRFTLYKANGLLTGYAYHSPVLVYKKTQTCRNVNNGRCDQIVNLPISPVSKLLVVISAKLTCTHMHHTGMNSMNSSLLQVHGFNYISHDLLVMSQPVHFLPFRQLINMLSFLFREQSASFART